MKPDYWVSLSKRYTGFALRRGFTYFLKKYLYVCVGIKRYHVVDHKKGDIGQNRGKKVKNVENDFLTEMYSRDTTFSKTVDSISKC